MRQKGLIIACFALFICAGGIIGHVVAGSLASLIASSIISAAMMCCAFLTFRGKMLAYDVATFISAFLCLFFIYRFSLSFKIAPAGIMAISSGILFIYLLAERSKQKQLAKN